MVAGNRVGGFLAGTGLAGIDTVALVSVIAGCAVRYSRISACARTCITGCVSCCVAFWWMVAGNRVGGFLAGSGLAGIDAVALVSVIAGCAVRYHRVSTLASAAVTTCTGCCVAGGRVVAGNRVGGFLAGTGLAGIDTVALVSVIA